jgi:hypothetical protein
MEVCEGPHKQRTELLRGERGTHNLLDNLRRGVQVNQALVDFELVAVPGLGTLTARLGGERFE